MTENKQKTECDRCGTCCLKGGPALHYEDRWLVQNNHLQLEHLITIRKGEPIFSLGAEMPEASQTEVIKMKGKGSEWTCFFFDEQEASCTIYKQRPLECSLLKCWDTAALEKVAGRNLLCRTDIIGPHDPLLQFIERHEEKCSLKNLGSLLSEVRQENSEQQAQNFLTDLVNSDLAIRTQAYAKYRFSLDLELFFFGRPLFKILQQFGLATREENGICSLAIDPSLPAARLGGL